MVITNNILKIKNKGSLIFNLIIALIALMGVIFFGLVIFTVFTSASKHNIYGNIFSRPFLYCVMISLETSFAVVLLSVLVGIPIAYILARKNFPGKSFVDTLLDMPIVMPPLVSGLAILMLLGPDHPVGSMLRYFNMNFIFSRKGIIIAQFFVSAPFFIKSVKESMSLIPNNILAAAETLHASKFYTFRHVILPLSKNGIIAGIVMCWARALGEFGATAMVAGCIPGKTETMTLAIYSQSMSGDLNSAVVIALALMLFSFSSLLIMKKYLGSNHEFSFR